MKVLITGSQGFIAGYTINEAKERGWHTVGTQRQSGGSLADTTYQCDMRDSAGMLGVIEKVDGVIHLSGLLGTTENMSAARELVETNVLGSMNVIDACTRFKIPLVMISVGNYFEHNPYSISKETAMRFGQMAVKESGAKINFVRALNAFGAYQKVNAIKKIMPTFITKALRGEDIQVYGGKKNCSEMDMVYAGDVAKVLCEALTEDDYGNIYEAGTGKAYKVWDIAEKVIKFSGSKSKLVEVPMRPGETERSLVQAENPYPIEYQDFDKILKETIGYYRCECF